MKRTFKILMVGIVLISSNIYAQDYELDNRENIKLGLKAGLNYSNAYNSDTEEFRADAKVGFAGGVFVSIPIGKYLGVQPEILFTQKGFKGDGVLFGSEYKFTRTTRHIDIPLQVTLKPSEFITLLVGPHYSYLIKQTDEFESSLVSYLQEQEFKNDNIHKNMLGFIFGVDINLNKVVLSARLAWDVTSNHGDGTSSTPRYKNAWFQSTIGYTF